MRIIEMKWTQRNIDRIFKWLKLESDFAGMLFRNGKAIGYKTAQDGRKIKFCFNQK